MEKARMPVPDTIPDCSVFLLAKAYQRAHGLVKKHLKPFGLTNIQHLVLEGLWYQAGVTASELGKMLRLDKATLSGVLERMADANWIVKEQDTRDKRVIRLYPSRHANALKERLVEARQKANDELLADFNLEEKVLLKRLLRDLI
jgi:DNA-binding MarR family transcriptional regulator